jgi:hypothetical protein
MEAAGDHEEGRATTHGELRIERPSEPRVERRIPKRPAVLAFFRPLRSLGRTCPPEVYEREWGHPFPARILERIEEALGSGE